MNYIFKKYLFKATFFSILFCCVVAYEFLLTDNKDIHGDLVYFKDKVKNGDLIFRESLYKETNVGIIETGMFGKVYVWDTQNTMKQNLYDWAKKSKERHVTVYRIISPAVQVHEMTQHEIDSLVYWHKLEYITASWN